MLVVHVLLQLAIISQLGLPLGLPAACVYACSVPVWTGVEYYIHRFIFHSEGILPDGPYWRLVHFSLHGIHHMLPMDPDRLVFPPALGLILWGLVYFAFSKAGDWAVLVFLGIHFGYVCYDMTHYFIHHSKGGALHWLKRYHAKHHYSGKPLGYGVSNPFWDMLIGTALPM